MQRLAKRPTLEADLAAALTGSDADTSDRAFLLVPQLQFAPSAALGEPLHRAMSRIAGNIRTVREPGSGNDFNSYLNSFFGDRLAAALANASKIADSAGIDLRDGLHELREAVIQAYPGSQSAKKYPGQVAATEKRIDAALATRPKPN